MIKIFHFGSLSTVDINQSSSRIEIKIYLNECNARALTRLQYLLEHKEFDIIAITSNSPISRNIEIRILDYENNVVYKKDISY